MTVTEKFSRKRISGSGWVNPLTHDFLLENSTYLKLYADDAKLTLGVDYSVADVGNPAGYVVVITTPGSWTPDWWVLSVETPIDQPVDVSLGGSFGLRFENALDGVARRMQVLADGVRRGLKLAKDADPSIEYTIPTPESRKVIGWNEAATDLQNWSNPTDSMEQAAASAAAALASANNADNSEAAAAASEAAAAASASDADASADAALQAYNDTVAAIAALGNPMAFKGLWDASAGTFPGGGAARAGWTYQVSVAGTVGGQVFDVNDRLIAVVDNASTTVYAANWFRAETDLVQSVAGLQGVVSAVDLRDATDTAPYVPTRTSLKALDTTKDTLAYMTEAVREGPFIWTTGNYAALIAGDTQEHTYIKADAIAATAGAWVRAGASPTGFWGVEDGARAHRLADRVFVDLAHKFGGEWEGYAGMTGLDATAKALHNWGPRDASLYVDSSVGAMSIVGHSQASKASAWPGSPTFVPASIGVSGFAINDVAGGQAWGLYSDAVRMSNGGFTLSLESVIANFGAETELTPFNHLTSANHGCVGHWIASGAGLDVVAADLANAGLSPWDVNHSAAGTVYLSNYTVASGGNWTNSTAYVVGDLRTDPETDVVYRCMTAHTSPAGGFFSSARMANPAHWKARPAFKKGIVFTAGGLAEAAAGANVFTAMSMTERTQISWYRNAAGVSQQSAFIWADTIPDGSAAVGITFKQDLVDITGATGIRAAGLLVGDLTNYLTMTRAAGANGNVTIANPGTGIISFSQNGAVIASVNQFAFNLEAGKIYGINNVQVLGARKTGWAVATGTATRTTFATGSVTLPQLAERVKALIDDLHATAGHGIIGT